MTAEPSPPDEFIERAEALDEALWKEQTAEIPEADIPAHVAAGLHFLREAYAGTRTDGSTYPGGYTADTTKPEMIGRFQLHECLGTGSFGVVYRAFDTVLNRIVALKLPRLVTTLSDDLLERFLRESEAAARLHHPHVVPVFEAGSTGSTAYIASEYRPGFTLETWLRQRRDPTDCRAVAKMMLHLADAVEHAHQAGILHRDLKPANILLAGDAPHPTEPDDVILSSAKITDFGLARFLDEGASTIAGGLVGTIAYMAPEQAGKSKEALGPACDVYALGVILYELLTLVRPHQGEHHGETLRRICDEEPVRPRRLQPMIPRDLESICLRCLEKKPHNRFASAGHLRDDLQRFLDGRATLARPLPVAEQTMRAAFRHPVWTVLVVALLLTIAVGGVATAYHFRELGDSIRIANENWRLATEKQKEVADLLYVADLRVGLTALQQGDRPAFQRQLEKYRDQRDMRGIEWDFLQSTIPTYEDEVAAHQGAIYSCAVSPDGKLLATVGQDRVVRLWEISTHKLHAELYGHSDEINDVAFAPDGTRLATSSDDHTVRVWDLASAQMIQTLPHADVVYGVAFSPDGTRLFSGGKGKIVRVWNSQGEPETQLGPFRFDIDQLAFSQDGVLGIVAGKNIELWDVSTRQEIITLGLTDRLTRLAFSADGQFVAGATHAQKVVVWHRATGERLAVWRGHRAPVHDVEFSPNGNLLYSCGRDGTVRLWPLSEVGQSDLSHQEISESNYSTTSRVENAFQAHPGRAWSMAFVPESQIFITTGHDGQIRYWSENKIRRPKFTTVAHDLFHAVLSPDGRLAIATSNEGVWMWDVQTQSRTDTLPDLPSRSSQYLGVSRNGKWIAVGLQDGRIAVGSLKNNGAWNLLQGHSDDTTSIEFSPASDSLLVSAASDGTIRFWDVAQGTELRRFRVTENTFPVCFGLSSDGQFLAHSSGDAIVVRNMDSWDIIAEWKVTRDRALSMAFSPDNTLLACAMPNHAIELLELSTHKTTMLIGHADRVTSVVFSNDGRTVFSGAADGSVRAWHVRSAQEIGILFQDSVIIRSLRFSQDGQKLLASYLGSGNKAHDSGLLLWQVR